MNIKVDSQGNSRIVRIEGEITLEHCPYFQSRLDSIIAERGVREVDIDFRDVPFIDSSGVGEVIRFFKRMKKINGDVVLLNPNKKLHDLFRIYRFDRFMRICEGKDTGGEKSADP